MGLRETWSEQDTAVKALIVVGVVVIAIPIVVIVGFVVLVLLSAVLGSFVLGLGSQAGAAPPAVSFGMEYAAGAQEVTLVHEAGDEIEAARVTIEVGPVRTEEWDAPDGEVTAGDETTVEDVDEGAEIRVTWTDEEGEEHVLFEGTAEPSATSLERNTVAPTARATAA